MKKTLLLFFVLLFFYLGFAQNGLLVQSNEKGMYVTHTVSAKENFYSIGRLYAIAPKDIASFNGIDMANGLSIGQTIMIPLNASNFSQTDERGTPVYYVVGDKEGLYRVSVKNNKVLMANLRKWNRLSSDNISTGQRLIVGYLQSTQSNSGTRHYPTGCCPTAGRDSTNTTTLTASSRAKEIRTCCRDTPSSYGWRRIF
jgi:LysM repeat protein